MTTTAAPADVTPPALSCDDVEPVDILEDEDLLVEDVSIDGMCGVY